MKLAAIFLLLPIIVIAQEPPSVGVMKGPISKIQYSPDGKYLAVSGMQGDIVILEASTWKKLHRFKFSSSRVNSTIFSSDNSLLGISSDDKSVRIAKLNGDVVHTFKSEGPAGSVAFSPDGSKLVGMKGDGYLRVWDTNTGAEKWKISLSTGGGNLVWHPKGDRIFYSTSGVGGTIVVLNASNGAMIANNNNHVGTVQFISLTNDGEVALASVARGGNTPALITMNGTTAATQHNFESHLAGGNISPDGSKIIGLGADGDLRVFDIASKQRLYKGNPVMKFKFFKPETFALSPDGKTVLIGGDLVTEYGFYVLEADALK